MAEHLEILGPTQRDMAGIGVYLRSSVLPSAAWPASGLDSWLHTGPVLRADRLVFRRPKMAGGLAIWIQGEGEFTSDGQLGPIGGAKAAYLMTRLPGRMRWACCDLCWRRPWVMPNGRLVLALGLVIGSATGTLIVALLDRNSFAFSMQRLMRLGDTLTVARRRWRSVGSCQKHRLDGLLAWWRPKLRDGRCRRNGSRCGS